MYSYARNVMTVCVSSTIKHEGVTYASAVHIVFGKKFPKDCYCMAMLDDRHRHHSVKMRTGEDDVELAAETLRMPYAFRADDKAA